MTSDLVGTSSLAMFGVIIAAGFLISEPWRWAGVWLARELNVESEIFRWVKAVSTALVAGLVARMVLFPSGVLAETEPVARLAAFVAGIAAYYAAARFAGHGGRITIAVLVSVTVLIAVELVMRVA